ncbi:MAG: DUF2785 domain-containing protein [Streptosporangiales bacterium]|nr:DUF2785 domain-containing protein [Streptosporangiales bacterium]
MVMDSQTAANQVAFWEQVLRDDCALPSYPPLDELTVDLTRMLGSPDGHERDEVAYPVLSTWIRRGVYDDLLEGLGDGMCVGLDNGLGADGHDAVFRRSFSAVVLADIIARDTEAERLHPDILLRWGDRGIRWLVKERDLRGQVPACGRAHAAAHGADLLLALALSRHFGEGELMVLLDAIGDRLLEPTDYRLVHGEPERLAYATMGILHRNVLEMDVIGPWLERLADGWKSTTAPDAGAVPFNTVSYLRCLHLQLQLGVQPLLPAGRAAQHFTTDVACRIDLLGGIARLLRTTGPWYRQRSL